MQAAQILDARVLPLEFSELLEDYTEGLLVFHNLDTINKLRKNADFRDVCAAAEYCVADGKVLVMAARFLGTPVPAKISGSDFLSAFCLRHAADEDVRVFLLGAGPGVADLARERLNDRAGREVVVGSWSPSFGFENDPQECAEIIRRIGASGATVLAVGLGAPKQEIWMHRYREQLPTVRRFIAVGATLDFEAGRISRAPAWMSEAGLEWLYRLGQEPRRLWRRYLLEGPRVLALVSLQRVGLYAHDPTARGIASRQLQPLEGRT